MGNRVAELLAHKGFDVRTIAPDASVQEAVELLDHHGVGALVVAADGRHPIGIISERDVIRRVSQDGPSALSLLVDTVMTTELVTCTTATSANELAAMMTAHRIRHVPVVEGGLLVGLVSIGDVVRARMDELATERDELQAYVAGSY